MHVYGYGGWADDQIYQQKLRGWTLQQKQCLIFSGGMSLINNQWLIFSDVNKELVRVWRVCGDLIHKKHA